MQDAEIRQGDCLEELPLLPAASVDVIVTSPPYNVGVAYRSYDDRRPRSEYLAWLGEIGRELRRVLKPNGSFFLNVGSTGADPWIAMDVAAVFRDQFDAGFNPGSECWVQRYRVTWSTSTPRSASMSSRPRKLTANWRYHRTPRELRPAGSGSHENRARPV